MLIQPTQKAARLISDVSPKKTGRKEGSNNAVLF